MGTQDAILIAAALCRTFEGFSSTPYICPAGYPTIGYGTVYKPDGTKVTMNDAPISKELAEQWLMRELERNYMAGTLKASPHLIAFPRILGALTDFSYNPGVKYTAYKGATATPWIPDDEMIMGSFDSPSYRIYRGIDVVNETVSKIIRTVGELVFDTYISASPVAEFFRSHTRHLFLMGNINHTLRSTGSNFN